MTPDGADVRFIRKPLYLHRPESITAGEEPMSDQASSQNCHTADGTCPSDEFRAFCDAELERRVNSGESFDPDSFDKAVEMAFAKLRVLEQEGGK